MPYCEIFFKNSKILLLYVLIWFPEVAHLVQDVPFFEWNALETQEAKSAYLEAAVALELQNNRTHHLAA